jgi:chromate reductase, NAD(P)H dehydrogenase (quinone)
MPEDPYRIAGIAGSLRRDSFNKRLLGHAAAAAPPSLEIDVLPDALRLPLFDQDLEEAGDPAEVVALRTALAEADGLLLVTPEYNFGVPGPVKNLVDWMSRPPGRSPLRDKPVLLMGASTGRLGGTIQAQGQLRVSLGVLGAHVMPSPPVLVAEAGTRFDGDTLADDPTQKIVALALARFADFVAALRPR